MTIASILSELWRGGGGAFEAPTPGPGTLKKSRRNRVKTNICCLYCQVLSTLGEKGTYETSL